MPSKGTHTPHRERGGGRGRESGRVKVFPSKNFLKIEKNESSSYHIAPKLEALSKYLFVNSPQCLSKVAFAVVTHSCWQTVWPVSLAFVWCRFSANHHEKQWVTVLLLAPAVTYSVKEKLALCVSVNIFCLMINCKENFGGVNKRRG